MNNEERELNKRLAVFAGFKQRTCNFELTQNHMLYPGGQCALPPEFTKSFYACLKWLKPVIVNKGWRIEIYTVAEDTAVTFKKEGNPDIFTCDFEFALAFCISVDKLIRREK
jgi:hypothetical protein